MTPFTMGVIYINKATLKGLVRTILFVKKEHWLRYNVRSGSTAARHDGSIFLKNVIAEQNSEEGQYYSW